MENIISNKKKSDKLTLFYILYMSTLLILSIFSKIKIDTMLEFSGYTNIFMGSLMMYHTLL